MEYPRPSVFSYRLSRLQHEVWRCEIFTGSLQFSLNWFLFPEKD